MLSSPVTDGDTAAASQYNNLREDVSRAGPVGSLVMWLTDTAPDGWLLCYGQAVSRATYAELFAVLGTTFGSGDGSTTFNLPDMRGRFPLGQDDMGGTAAGNVTDAAADTIGGIGGEEDHVLTDAEVPPQSVTVVTDPNSGSDSGTQAIQQANGSLSIVTTNLDTIASYTTEGGGGAHNNMPPYITVNYIIKV